MAATEFSFDVVSQIDQQELRNALDQVRRELTQRYDLKNSGSSVEVEGQNLKLASASEMTLEAVRDLVLERSVRRGLSPKIFDYGKIEEASKGTVRQTVRLREGLSQELQKEITKLVRDRLPKLKSQIQGDAVRVTGKNKDDLQTAIQTLRSAEKERNWPVPLQFKNYR
jgi:cyclic-di-GMP-binding protein